MKDDIYKLEKTEVLKNLNTSNEGLSDNEALIRLNDNGKNEIDNGKKKSGLIKFIEQFKNLMVIILIITSIISFVVAYYENESYFDAIIILLIVILNAIFGYIQEAKADKAIDELKNIDNVNVKVRRNNKIELLDMKNLVVGDLILLEAGDYVPADARIIWHASLKVEEAPLTGESKAIEKNIDVINKDVIISERYNMVFTGSNVVYGKCEAIVVKTGMDTELGKIAKSLLAEDTTITPLQKKINNISKILSIIIGVIVLIMLAIGLYNGNDFLHVFMGAVSLAVAAIPEGLPAVITIILSLGMTRLANKKAVVRKISSVETLGSTNVICSDKTGTITENKMTVREFYFNNTISSSIKDGIFNKIMYLCNDVSKNDNEYIGDPTEIALYISAEDKGYKDKRIYEFPFDSERKLMSTINTNENNEAFTYTKGSCEYLLTKCSKIYINGKIVNINDDYIKQIKENELKLSNKALRVLALAYKEVSIKDNYTLDEIENDLIFVGLVGMIDPPRANVKESINNCYKAGIKPIMITGDSLPTAISIASEVGIYKDTDIAMLGIELDKLSDKELADKIDKITVYARVTPEHKLRIVKTWQSKNKIVAMTGDGVNDAPAIKSADIGIGMGITGTEVSKGVSDIVLLDDSFNTIPIAIEEGRNIYENIRKAITYLLTANIAEVIIVFIGMLFNKTIFLPIHLLYINLVTDSLPAIALSYEKNDSEIMSKPARKNSSSLFTPFLTAKITFSAILKAIAVLSIYFISDNYIDSNMSTTLAFLSLIILELLYAVSSRNLFRTILNKNIFKNKQMNFTIIFLIILQVIIFITPLKDLFEIVMLNQIAIILVVVISTVAFLIDELVKQLIYTNFSDE